MPVPPPRGEKVTLSNSGFELIFPIRTTSAVDLGCTTA
ncbi:Uncharacterised protein [Vibrio cholerae]|nr:Uncharacterised protein [Vibrio cholerae]CSI58584.1 Uncharacterised protein [Vibrio cholerae]